MRFVKTKTYNKLIEILYGKDYKNPENDKPEDDDGGAICNCWGGAPSCNCCVLDCGSW